MPVALLRSRQKSILTNLNCTQKNKWFYKRLVMYLEYVIKGCFVEKLKEKYLFSIQNLKQPRNFCAKYRYWNWNKCSESDIQSLLFETWWSSQSSFELTFLSFFIVVEVRFFSFTESKLNAWNPATGRAKWLALCLWEIRIRWKWIFFFES